MKRTMFFLMLFLLSGFYGRSQDFGYRIGLGLGLDMGVGLTDRIPEQYRMEYKHAALPTVDIFTRITWKNFHFTPDFKISYATLGSGKRTAVNLSGFNIPEGNAISLPHSGTIEEKLERDLYLLDKTRVLAQNLSVGLLVGRQLLNRRVGGPEIGLGFFYVRKTLVYKDYLGSDMYEYYGSAGDHVTQTQTDQYWWVETQRQKKPTKITRHNFDRFQIPVYLQYNFHTASLVDISPSFTACFGQEIYYNLGCSISFGHALNIGD